MRLEFLTSDGADLTLNYNGHMQVRPLTRGGGSFFEFYGVFDAADGNIAKASDWLRTNIFDSVSHVSRIVWRRRRSQSCRQCSVTHNHHLQNGKVIHT